MSLPTFFPRSLALAVLAAAPLAAVAQVNSAASNFAAELGTENVIVTNNLTMNGGHTDSGVAAGGSLTLTNAVLNSTAAYKDDAYAIKDYGTLTLTGTTDSNNSGAEVLKQINASGTLKDFSVNNGTNRALEFTNSSTYNNSEAQIFFNGNSGKPAAANLLSTTDNYFTSRASALTSDSSIFAGASAVNPINTSGTLTFNAAAHAITVFNWDVAKQGSINQVAINVAAGSNAIINLFDFGGTTWSPTFNFTGNGATAASADRVIFNIEGSETIDTSREWWGSILGVNATINDGQNIDGQVFANNLTVNNSGEIHFDEFAPIPEPATDAALIGLAALLVAVARCRRFARCHGHVLS